jgi:hypothetical protein
MLLLDMVLLLSLRGAYPGGRRRTRALDVTSARASRPRKPAAAADHPQPVLFPQLEHV